ncbi:hypothetical protein ATANTOWER_004113, partial [Ataeniobius toweri]|nr:hypothetical protein [Ataeniobius toweri]
STYTRCDFEDSFCDLIQSSETLFGWTRTAGVPGLRQDHRNTSAHFLSLSPVGEKKITADLRSPVFLPSHSCQIRFHHHVGAAHGDLRILLQPHLAGQSTEVWKHSKQLQTEIWQRAVVNLSSNQSFQVCHNCKISSHGFDIEMDIAALIS